MIDYAIVLYVGHIVKQDEEAAFNWIKKAINKQRSVETICKRAKFLEKYNKFWPLVCFLYKNAADEGHFESMVKYANLTHSFPEKAHYFKMAIEKNNNNADDNLMLDYIQSVLIVYDMPVVDSNIFAIREESDFNEITHFLQNLISQKFNSNSLIKEKIKRANYLYSELIKKGLVQGIEKSEYVKYLESSGYKEVPEIYIKAPRMTLREMEPHLFKKEQNEQSIITEISKIERKEINILCIDFWENGKMLSLDE